MELSPTAFFLILFFSVPLQYYLSPKNSGELKFYLTQLVDEIKQWFGPKESKLLQKKEKAEFRDETDVILEALQLKEGHFGSSEVPRDPRAPWIKYKVGQVFRHKENKYRGVIVGWDEKAQAPEWWFTDVQKGNKVWRDNPNYVVLIDSRDRQLPQIGYVVEENIQPITGQSIQHSLVSKYFEGYNGKEYKLRPWLQKIYPYG